MRRGSMGRLVGFLLAAAASAARNETSQPHIVLAIVDDLGYGDVGYNNRELHAATPTMNKLASGGVTLTSFYASPTCTASRAALFTGKYPMHLGLQDSVIHPSEPRGVADPALFGGVWTPWRDDLGMPYATYQLATKTVHNTLGGDNKPKPAEAAEASAEQTNAGHNRRLAEARGGGVSAATLALGAALGYAGAQLRR